MPLNWTDAEERKIQSYVRLVKDGKITLEDVPEKYRDEVERRLTENTSEETESTSEEVGAE